MHRVFAAALFLSCVASPALAINVHRCGPNDPSDPSAIAEPWEKNTRAFYNGQVRVALVDTGGEPVCCSMHLMILVPEIPDETGSGGRSCWMADNEGSVGFVGIDFAHVAGRYDAGKGLLITFPYELYNEGNPGKRGVGHVRVNMAKGTAAAE